MNAPQLWILVGEDAKPVCTLHGWSVFPDRKLATQVAEHLADAWGIPCTVEPLTTDPPRVDSQGTSIAERV